MNGKFYLTRYSTSTNDLVGEEELNITKEEICKLFWLGLNEYFDCIIVRASQRGRLQELTKHKIDLNEFDYFVEFMV